MSRLSLQVVGCLIIAIVYTLPTSYSFTFTPNRPNSSRTAADRTFSASKTSGASRFAQMRSEDSFQGSKLVKNFLVSTVAALSFMSDASARPEGVNRPDLLPKEQTSVIDVANFLTKGQERKLTDKIQKLEDKTGLKVRLLCQSYPETPGLAIKDFWGIDDKTLVVVADRGEGFTNKNIPSNLIHLNIGASVEQVLPSMFWSRLTNKLGNVPYVRENGEDLAVINAVEAITYCLEDGACKDLPFDL